jgi:hypothetical protein
MGVSILDMKPIRRSADRSPVYRFNTPFSSRGVSTLNIVDKTPNEAQSRGDEWARKAEREGILAVCLGVTQVEGGFSAVVNIQTRI